MKITLLFWVAFQRLKYRNLDFPEQQMLVLGLMPETDIQALILEAKYVKRVD